MEFVKKHIISILCAISIVLLALPLASVLADVEMSTPFGDFSSEASSKSTFSGFQALGKSVFAYLLILGPAVLIAMNYVQQLGKYKGILAIAVPCACIVALLIVLLSVKSFSASASSSLASVDVKVQWGVGAFLLFASYIGTAVAGAITYHNFKLNKEGLQQLKSGATNLFDAAQQKVTEMVQERSSNGETPSAPPATEQPAPAAAPILPKLPKKEPVSVKRVDEILSLIEKLAAMKDNGILTEEEFSEKKKQLLEEIK